jgi:hypothetical protein
MAAVRLTPMLKLGWWVHRNLQRTARRLPVVVLERSA